MLQPYIAVPHKNPNQIIYLSYPIPTEPNLTLLKLT
jgi:hypothetical protein